MRWGYPTLWYGTIPRQLVYSETSFWVYLRQPFHKYRHGPQAEGAFAQHRRLDWTCCKSDTAL